MLKPEFTGQFKKDYKLALKRGLDAAKLETVVTMLCEGKELPKQYKDHQLNNSKHYKNVREYHIEPDWLLVYKAEEEVLILKLIRTGTHSDLFGGA